jgi:hypothetical protein
MNAEEIKTKAAELAELFSAVAKGKVLQNLLMHGLSRGWKDTAEFPCMASDLSFWRVKPEPRRMWGIQHTYSRTDSENIAKQWKAAGYPITEWQEVLPE